MDDNKEYNDIESLAAYLHSGKMFSQVNHDDETAQGVSSAEKNVDDILFSIDNKRKRPDAGGAVRPKRRDVPQMSAVMEYDGDEDDDDYEGGKKSKPEKRKKTEKPRDNAASMANTADDLSAVLGVAPPPPIKLRSSSTPSPDLTTEEMDLSEEERAEEQRRELENDIIATYAPQKNTEPEPEPENYDASATRMMNAVGRQVQQNTGDIEQGSGDEDEDEGLSREDRRRLVQMRRNYERQKQRTRTFAYILLGVFLSIVIVGASAYGATFLVRWALDFTGIGSVDFKIDVQIPENSDANAVAAILAENNLITSPQFFTFYTDISDKYLSDPDDPTEFIAGKYTLSSTMQYSAILNTLRSKTVEKKEISIRIAEGMTAHEIAVLLEENNVCYAEDFEKFYKNVQYNYDFERRVKESPLKFNQLEGYLFPDTYDFYVLNSMETGIKPDKNGSTAEAEAKAHEDSLKNAEAAAKKMYRNFNDKMTRSMYKRMGEMNLTLDEVLAIASLVQREAAYAEDMELVASVFLNRIRNSEEFPCLESDVSIIYVENDIKPYITGSQSSKEKIYNAYNTYVCKGIPAGAVCNPGLDAINAVLYAADTNFYYFCANPETGDIYYASNHDDHIKNIELAGLTYDPTTDRYYYDDNSRID